MSETEMTNLNSSLVRTNNITNSERFPIAIECRYLSWALTCSLIPLGRSSPRWFKRLNSLVCLCLLVNTVGTIIYVPVTTVVTKEHDLTFQSVLGVFWYIYCVLAYVTMSKMGQGDRSILDLLQDVARREKSNNFSDSCESVQPIGALLLISFVVVVINFVIVIVSPEYTKQAFGVTHHPVYMAYLSVCTYFLSTGWVLPISIVFLGSRTLTKKISYLIGYIKCEFHSQSVDEETPLDIAFAMSWHDELFEKNRCLNQAISGLVTLTMGFLSGAMICFALYFVVTGFDFDLLFWFLVCLFSLGAICFPTGELEIQNKLLSIELGSLPISVKCAQSILFMHQYQTFSIKSEKTPFGIFVKGTKLLFSFNSMIKIASITLSGIVFLGGLVRAK